MKKLFLVQLFGFMIFVFFSGTVSAQSVWTKQYEETIYSQVYSSVNLNFPNDSLKREFSNCLVKKLKIALPDGLASIQRDSLNKLVNKIGIACKLELGVNILTKWSAEFEKKFRVNLYSSLKKTLSEEIKLRICDCLIAQYKAIYPNGMPKEIPLEIENKVLGICFVKVIKDSN